jgi:hypothetical protein
MIGSATTDTSGAWIATVPLATNAAVRALYRGDPEHPAVVSRGLIAVVPPQIALTAAAQQGPPGAVIQFTGALTPAKPRVSIVIARQQLDGTFATVRTIRLTADDDGAFARSIGFAEAGQYQVLAHAAADDVNALGTSAPVPIAIA